MDLNYSLRSLAGQPITHQVLLSLLKQYKRPNDKVHALLNEGILEPVKKGLYVAGNALQAGKTAPFLLANHILGPSYVSTDAALAYHGCIPERVFEISSVTTKVSRVFHTSMGVFSYTRLPLPYYAFGITRVMLSGEQYALVASPEKAICDKIITTRGLVLRSKKQAQAYLLDDLRMAEERLREMNTPVIQSWLADAPKNTSLQWLIKVIETL